MRTILVLGTHSSEPSQSQFVLLSKIVHSYISNSQEAKQTCINWAPTLLEDLYFFSVLTNDTDQSMQI